MSKLNEPELGLMISTDVVKKKESLIEKNERLIHEYESLKFYSTLNEISRVVNSNKLKS